jgi:hypothetical protein
MDPRLGSQFDFYLIGGIHTSFRRHGGNTGEIEMIRPDYLDIDLAKKRLAWSYLSPDGLRDLNICDLDKKLAIDAADTAVNGAIISLIYARFSLSRYYLKRACSLYPQIILKFRFWKALFMNLSPLISKKILARKFKISSLDYQAADSYEIQSKTN